MSRCFLVLPFIMAVFTGGHGIVKVIPDGLLNRIPFGKIMSFVTEVAGYASKTFRLMDIRLGAPLAASLLPIGDGMTGPAIFIRMSSGDLETEIVKIGYLFFRIIDFHLFCLWVPGILLREFRRRPAGSYRGTIFEEPGP